MNNLNSKKNKTILTTNLISLDICLEKNEHFKLN